jgi:glycosidase
MSDTIHRRKSVSIIMLMALLVSFVLPFASLRARPALAAPQAAPEASLVSNTPSAPSAVSWCVAGSFQGWNNASTPIYDDGSNGDLVAGDGVFSFRTAIATAGKSEFKAVECGNWGNAFPAQNSWFYTTQPNQSVLITFDTNNHASDAGVKLFPAQNIVNVAGDNVPTTWTAVGSFQGWSNTNPATVMTSVGNGVYRLVYSIAAAGTYEAKIAITGDPQWPAQYTATGRAIDGGGIMFTTTAPNEEVVFLLDTRSSRFTVQKNGAPSGSTSWCAAGEFQGWNNSSTPLFDDGTNGDLLGGDGVYSRDVTVAAAGVSQWKVPECGNWSNAFPAKNSWIKTTQPNQVVKLTFDTNNHAADAGAPLIPTQNILNAWDSANDFTVVGPFQGWANANPATHMTQVMSNVFSLAYQIPTPGTYETKIVTTGDWAGQVVAQGRAANADNPESMTFTTTTLSETVVFYFDNGIGRLRVTPLVDGVLPDSEVGDGLINKAAIRHDSRDSLYKVPFGAITLGTSATLRLRTAAHDVESVKVRLYNTADSSQSIKTMVKVATDADNGYEYWEYFLPAQQQLGVIYYRFIISDAATTVYYEDDSRYDGGLGETVNSSSDRSWNIYIYKPDFTTPEWAKNAVIYQIFVERFRNGDASNDPTANPADSYPGESTPTRGWFYPDERGHRFPVSPWNTIVPDPEPYTDTSREYWATYSSTMYGGDLKGVQDKLDYLQSLGVTTLYLNPIFDSPSNHKYDGRNYRTVDPAFGGPAAFASLATAVHARGMYLVLDGVPNHVSSDSPFFDRFGRHPEVGACESQNSPYRSWFFFQDVAAGAGKCVSSTGVVNGANYTGWFGVQSLPQINTAHPEVMAYWFGTPGGNPNLPSNTASYWVNGNDKADGWRIDVVPDIVGVNPTFFETWRTTMKAANPDAVLYSETWPEEVVRDRVLGDEFDSTMNYRYRKAVLGFLRDTRWTDNDGGQEVDPLSPSQFINAFTTMQEDYPKPAFDAAMNLIDSHDTNRAVHVLNELGFTGTGYNRQPVDGFADARKRLSMVAVLQMTLPGAPTIYYGDEVGLTGFGYDVPRDDPYNRQPYPWSDAAGYGTLPAWRQAQGDLLSHYQSLGTLRGNHTFLRTGSFDPLLTDDANKVLAYGRKDGSGAAIVVMNRDDEAHTVALDLKTYIPLGTTLNQALPMTGTVSPAGTTYQFVVPANSYGIWVTPANANMGVLSAPTNLAISQQLSQSVSLQWTAVAGASSYNVYRSLVSGGGYELVGTSAGTTYTDATVEAGSRYYYIVKAVGSNGFESAASNEVFAVPSLAITNAIIISPAEMVHTIGVTPTQPFTARVTIPGLTNVAGDEGVITAQIGYGPLGSNPETWTRWSPMTYNAACAACAGAYEFTGRLRPETTGTFGVLVRFSTNNGYTWTYGDRNGPNIGRYRVYLPRLNKSAAAADQPAAPASPLVVPKYQYDSPAILVVIANSDTTPPAAPQNLRAVSWSADNIKLEWNAVADAAEYWLYRRVGAASFGEPLVRLTAPITTYTDLAVTTGVTYTYAVKAVDPALNQSPLSNQVSQQAALRMATVTFRVRVPDATPDGDTVYIAGDNATAFGQTWTPNSRAMTEVAPNVWEYSVQLVEGTTLQYKYTRGAWERVEWWGEIVSVSNRSVTTGYGPGGVFVVDNTATDWGTGPDSTKAVRYWRDPVVASVTPANGSSGAAPATVSAAWLQPVEATTTESAILTVVKGATPVAGTVARVDDNTFAWTPSAALTPGTYTVTAFNVKRSDIGGEAVPQQAPYTWTFNVQ